MIILSYVKRNCEEIINLIEAVIRVAGSICSFTSTDKDDSVVSTVKSIFSKVKDWILNLGR